MENEKVSPSVDLPILYSCSGCSSAGQMANTLALRMDRERLAEMSCIAGIGGDVPTLMRKARSGKPLLVIDGCPLHCALHSLRQRELKPDRHVDLSRLGVAKEGRQNFSQEQASRLYGQVTQELGRSALRP